MSNPLAYYNTLIRNVVLPDNEQSITAVIPFATDRPIPTNVAQVTVIPPISVTLIRRGLTAYTVRFNRFLIPPPFPNPVGDVSIVKEAGVDRLLSSDVSDYKVSIPRLVLSNGVSAQFLQLETATVGVTLIYVFILPDTNLASLTSMSIRAGDSTPETVTRVVFPSTDPVTF